jgi:hypothetical protein
MTRNVTTVIPAEKTLSHHRDGFVCLNWEADLELGLGPDGW